MTLFLLPTVTQPDRDTLWLHDRIDRLPTEDLHGDVARAPEHLEGTVVKKAELVAGGNPQHEAGRIE